ncbi:MAG: DNA replication/repair protein RecF [Buchananella hordeovulneris]|nr:DNA replication/repair protein RecF [Buchananella hordeovulneris]
MYVSNLALDDFRSYRRLVLELPAGVVAFIGRNGQGKTNVVESLVYLSTFASHRVAADAALVRRALAGGQQPGGAVVRVKVWRGERSEVLELEIVAGRAHRARLNRGACRPRELLGHLRTVLFAPEDLALVKADPAGRRDFMDSLLIQHTPRLAGVKSDLERVLRQRGALLKQLAASRGGYAGAEESLLAVWDEQLVELGTQLLAARLELVEQLAPLAARYYRQVAGSEDDLQLEVVVSAREHAQRAGYQPGPLTAGRPRGEESGTLSPDSRLDDAQLGDAQWDDVAPTGGPLARPGSGVDSASARLPESGVEHRADFAAGQADPAALSVTSPDPDAPTPGVDPAAAPGGGALEGAGGNVGPQGGRAERIAQLQELLWAAIAARRADEVRRGVNLVGPQRDDLAIVLNGLPAKGYASHGESWSCALALKLAAFELLRGLDGDPVLILDDVFAELDSRRRAALVEAIRGVEQVFITAAVASDVPEELDAARFAVEAAQVTSLDGRGRVVEAPGAGDE